MEHLLEVKHLNIVFFMSGTPVQAVSDFSFYLDRNEALGIVGESGSGKSVTSLAIMGLLPKGMSGTEGEILFDGKNLLSLSDRDMRTIRGKKLAMIFQEPMTSLNPVHTCGRQITESILLHTSDGRKKAKDKAIHLLEQCGVPDPAQRYREYPHQLSGGLRQRVMIAIALACDPDLLIADEPTTALDVTIQAQILHLFKELRGKKDMSIVMITHDLGVVSEFCDRVIVVYAGEAVEVAPARELFTIPLHPYTQGLIHALPKIGRPKEPLEAIEGVVPDLGDMPKGCRFHPRCAYAGDRCRQEAPDMLETADGRCVRCHFPLYKRQDG